MNIRILTNGLVKTESEEVHFQQTVFEEIGGSLVVRPCLTVNRNVDY